MSISLSYGFKVNNFTFTPQNTVTFAFDTRYWLMVFANFGRWLDVAEAFEKEEIIKSQNHRLEGLRD